MLDVIKNTPQLLAQIKTVCMFNQLLLTIGAHTPSSAQRQDYKSTEINEENESRACLRIIRFLGFLHCQKEIVEFVCIHEYFANRISQYLLWHTLQLVKLYR